MPAKSSAVDLSYDSAPEYFDEVITATSLCPKKLFAYSKSGPCDWKRSLCWADARNNRMVMSALLDRTGGRMVKQKVLTQQLSSWLQSRGTPWSASDCEQAVYALRTMTAHFRDFVRGLSSGKKKWPNNCEFMKPIASNILFGNAPDVREDDESGDEDVSVVPLPPLKNKHWLQFLRMRALAASRSCCSISR